MTTDWIDLGDDHAYHLTAWGPDLDLNPQYAHLAELIAKHGQRWGAMVRHNKPSGEPCMGGIEFDTELRQRVYELRPMDPPRPCWQVQSWEPLTISPSLLCKADGCGDHGFIRNGKWERA